MQYDNFCNADTVHGNIEPQIPTFISSWRIEVCINYLSIVTCSDSVWKNRGLGTQDYLFAAHAVITHSVLLAVASFSGPIQLSVMITCSTKSSACVGEPWNETSATAQYSMYQAFYGQCVCSCMCRRMYIPTGLYLGHATSVDHAYISTHACTILLIFLTKKETMGRVHLRL